MRFAGPVLGWLDGVECTFLRGPGRGQYVVDDLWLMVRGQGIWVLWVLGSVYVSRLFMYTVVLAGGEEVSHPSKHSFQGFFRP